MDVEDIDPDLADVTLIRRALRTGVFREVRREVRASQAEWGAAAECSESEISRAERGLLTPRSELAGRMARVLRSALAALDASRPR